MTMNRRAFLPAGIAAAFAGPAAGQRAFDPAPKLPVCCFSKHLQYIGDYQERAQTAKRLGLDGLDLTVRGDGRFEYDTPSHDVLLDHIKAALIPTRGAMAEAGY